MREAPPSRMASLAQTGPSPPPQKWTAESLLRWLQARVLSEGKISEGDLDLMLVTDDPAEAANAIITAYKSIGKTAGDQFDDIAERARDGKR